MKRTAAALALCALAASGCIFYDPPGPAGTVVSRSYNSGHCSGSKKNRSCTPSTWTVRVNTKGETRRIRVDYSTYRDCPKGSRWPTCHGAKR
jgi:hypothetical protein